MYKLDKWKAKRKYSRISEKTLLGLAAIGGAVGALLSMKMYRHKVKKIKFSVGVPALLIAQIIVFFLILYYGK